MKTLFFLASTCILAWIGLILINSSDLSIVQLTEQIMAREKQAISKNSNSREVKKVDPSIKQKPEVQNDTSDTPAPMEITKQIITKANEAAQKIKKTTQPAIEKVENFFYQDSEPPPPLEASTEHNEILTTDIPDHEDEIDIETQEKWIAQRQAARERAQNALAKMDTILNQN
jgi:hypothetical protein